MAITVDSIGSTVSLISGIPPIVFDPGVDYGNMPVTLNVPAGTKYFLVNITRVNLAFVDLVKPRAGKLGKVMFDVTEKKLHGTKCSFSVLAWLQSVDSPQVPWTGEVAIEVLCFG